MVEIYSPVSEKQQKKIHCVQNMYFEPTVASGNTSTCGKLSKKYKLKDYSSLVSLGYPSTWQYASSKLNLLQAVPLHV